MSNDLNISIRIEAPIEAFYCAFRKSGLIPSGVEPSPSLIESAFQSEDFTLGSLMQSAASKARWGNHHMESDEYTGFPTIMFWNYPDRCTIAYEDYTPDKRIAEWPKDFLAPIVDKSPFWIEIREENYDNCWVHEICWNGEAWSEEDVVDDTDDETLFTELMQDTFPDSTDYHLRLKEWPRLTSLTAMYTMMFNRRTYDRPSVLLYDKAAQTFYMAIWEPERLFCLYGSDGREIDSPVEWLEERLASADLLFDPFRCSVGYSDSDIHHEAVDARGFAYPIEMYYSLNQPTMLLLDNEIAPLKALEPAVFPASVLRPLLEQAHSVISLGEDADRKYVRLQAEGSELSLQASDFVLLMERKVHLPEPTGSVDVVIPEMLLDMMLIALRHQQADVMIHCSDGGDGEIRLLFSVGDFSFACRFCKQEVHTVSASVLKASSAPSFCFERDAMLTWLESECPARPRPWEKPRTLGVQFLFFSWPPMLAGVYERLEKGFRSENVKVGERQDIALSLQSPNLQTGDYIRFSLERLLTLLRCYPDPTVEVFMCAPDRMARFGCTSADYRFMLVPRIDR